MCKCYSYVHKEVACDCIYDEKLLVHFMVETLTQVYLLGKWGLENSSKSYFFYVFYLYVISFTLSKDIFFLPDVDYTQYLN